MPIDRSKLSTVANGTFIDVKQTILDNLTELTKNNKIWWYKQRHTNEISTNYKQSVLVLTAISRKISNTPPIENETFQISIETANGKQAARLEFTLKLEGSDDGSSEYPDGSLLYAIELQNDHSLCMFMDELTEEEQNEKD